ncbi:hypothetical protein R1flu_015786 [Riccia fluitans]|uniref:Dynein regulatory complex protein 9 n=1 Tax=Riccia fluitans TaxID=41844 RepID=A0ABD1YK87_9MARC
MVEMAEAERKKSSYKEKEEGVRFNVEEKESSPRTAADAEEEGSSDVTDPELEATIPPVTPRPSIAAAIRRGSYYGDVASRISIMDVLANSESESELTERSSASTAASALTEETQNTVQDAEEEDLLSNKFRVYILGFLDGMLERLSLMAALPGASSITDTSVDLMDVPDGIQVLMEKKELLDAANLIHFSLGVPSKLSKFTIETSWLTEVLNTVRKEIYDCSTFTMLQDIMDKDELKIRSLPASIAHVKQLKEKMNMLHVLIEAEAQTHKEAMREWAKNLTERKKELKELRADNLVQYRYKADTSLASGDLLRRDYEVRLTNLRGENVRLKHDLEVEKKVHDASVEFLKKQNIDLREEAVSLQANFEIDTHNLDLMLEKMKQQKKDKELILAELEPRYMKEMAELEAARLEAIKQQEYFYANQGKCELELVAVMRIQRIWRGYLVRKVYRKVLKKLKRKRLKAKKKGNKAGPKKKKKGRPNKK